MTVVGAVRPRASSPAERQRAAGLTTAEARERLAASGPNVLAETVGPRWWMRFGRNLVHLFALLLWAGAALAAIGGMPQLAIAIVVVILVNAAFSFAQEHGPSVWLRRWDASCPSARGSGATSARRRSTPASSSPAT